MHKKHIFLVGLITLFGFSCTSSQNTTNSKEEETKEKKESPTKLKSDGKDKFLK